MSMNLHCPQVDLIQTPTWVTHMCLYADFETRAKSPWRTVMEKYLLWVTATWGNARQDWDVVDREKRKLAEAAQREGELTFEER